MRNHKHPPATYQHDRPRLSILPGRPHRQSKVEQAQEIAVRSPAMKADEIAQLLDVSLTTAKKAKARAGK